MSTGAAQLGVIETIPEKCRRCYSCVRECPVKAIKVEGGQARVIAERCIGCGNCYRICSQNAKKVLDGKAGTRRLLAEPERLKVALLAPSFPAAFMELKPERLLGAIRRLGFDRVCEVAFGADLNSHVYHELRNAPPGSPSSPRPARPSSTTSRSTPRSSSSTSRPWSRPWPSCPGWCARCTGPDAAVVFIGPCIGKKMEALDPLAGSAVDEVLTFQELVQLFAEAGVDPAAADPSDFDPPQAGLGQLFPVSAGLLKSADIREAPLDTSIISTNGRRRCMWVLTDFNKEHFFAEFIDLLMCEGCVNGPAMANGSGLYRRKEHVVRYARARVLQADLDTVAGQRGRLAGAGGPVAPLRGRPVPAAGAAARGAGPGPAPDGQGEARGRAQLRRLRLQHLPGEGRGGVHGAGRGGDVPALPDRQAGIHLPPAPGHQRPAAGRPGEPDPIGEAGLHGAAGGGRGPRDQQPAGLHPDVRPPAAGEPGRAAAAPRGPGADRPGGPPLQEHRVGAAQLRPPEPGAGAGNRRARTSSRRSSAKRSRIPG